MNLVYFEHLYYKRKKVKILCGTVQDSEIGQDKNYARLKIHAVRNARKSLN